jgi:hypothetical protein
MEFSGGSRESAAMPFPRLAALALTLAPALASAGDLDAAMQCVRGTMTSALVPVTASAEQVASVALARCGDEIENAAIAMAGAPLQAARIDASRMAVRRELHGYALAVAAGPVSDVTPEPASRTTAW